MIFFLYGEDTYRSREKLKEIVSHYQKTPKSGLNLRYFDGEKLDFQNIKDEFQTLSMFKEKKLFILTNVFGNKDFKEKFSTDVGRFVKSENVIVFYESGGDLTKDPFSAFLKKHAKSQEFEALTGQKLRTWLKNELLKLNARADAMAQEALVNRTGSDLWRLSNEIAKLAAFKKGKEITAKDVGLMVKPKVETDIFKTIDAIAQKNKKQALELLHGHLEKGDSPVYLLSMITYQFRNILGVKDLVDKGKTMSRSGLSPFVARKSYEQSRKFASEDLKKIYRKIFQLDHKIKTGQIDEQAALDLLIAEL